MQGEASASQDFAWSGPETLQPLTETSQAETEPTVQPTEPAGKAPPGPELGVYGVWYQDVAGFKDFKA